MLLFLAFLEGCGYNKGLRIKEEEKEMSTVLLIGGTIMAGIFLIVVVGDFVDNRLKQNQKSSAEDD